MISNKSIFTSESVTEGHPDKIADKISDSILDEILVGDKLSRAGCETLVTTDFVCVTGEVTTNSRVNIDKVIRDTIKEIGYISDDIGFNYKTCKTLSKIHEQSPDISQGVTSGMGLEQEQGAGDQGMMFGYAINETETLMPAPIYYAHKLTKKMTEVRQQKLLDYIYPDGKSQVTIEYNDGKPTNVNTIVLAQQHSEDTKREKLEEDLIKYVIKEVFPPEMLEPKPKLYINSTGKFVLGGPHADCGLTGRKIIVDTYGGAARHGGGAFSGKDPSKVDRSASYAARWVAKNIVAADLADKCEIGIAYSIGIAKPLWLNINTFNTAKVSEEKLQKIVNKNFDLRPQSIIKSLNLLRPIYKKTAAYGHFGRTDKDFTWEKTGIL